MLPSNGVFTFDDASFERKEKIMRTFRRIEPGSAILPGCLKSCVVLLGGEEGRDVGGVAHVAVGTQGVQVLLLLQSLGPGNFT